MAMVLRMAMQLSPSVWNAVLEVIEVAGGSPPPAYTPAYQFNDARNSMYLGAR